MKIEKLIKKALMNIKLNWTIDTHDHYRNHLNHFLRWSENYNITMVQDLSEEIIIEYISYMKKTCSNRTINIRIGNLKRAFKYANLDIDIFDNIKKFPETKKTFNMIDLKTLKQIRRYAFNLDSNVDNNLMYKSIILILMDTGIRRKELCLIEKKNVNLVDRTIKLTHTKNKEDRIVPFKEKTASVIKELLQAKNNHRYLLHNFLKDRPINSEDINYTLSKKMYNDIGIKVHAHMFRHSFASIMLENDAQLKVVMDLMGHKNIETTERYTHISKKRIKYTYNNTYNLDGD